MTPQPPAPQPGWRHPGAAQLVGSVAGLVAVALAVIAWLAIARDEAPLAAVASTSPTPTASSTTAAPETPTPTLAQTAPSPTTAVVVPAPTATSTRPPRLDLGGLRPALTVEAARELLATLPVAAEVLAGYNRDSFGSAWSDTDGNGCNQRDDVLLRDVLHGTVRIAAQDACDHDVLAGQWADPYTGTVLTFDDLKAPDQAQALQIDHVVPLAEAHRSGAHAWPPDRKELFANELANLVAVGGAANSSKGDSDPAEWLPPAVVQCGYVLSWVSVKAEWALSVDETEAAALSRVLAAC